MIGERPSQAGTPRVVSPRAASPAENPSSSSEIPLNELDRPQHMQGNGVPGHDANGSVVKRKQPNGGVDESGG